MAESQKTIKPGSYSVQDLLAMAGINVNDVTDYRTVKLGGLGFDYLDENIVIPSSAKTFRVQNGDQVIEFAVTE